MVSTACSLGGAIGQPSLRPGRRRQLLKERRAEEDENTHRGDTAPALNVPTAALFPRQSSALSWQQKKGHCLVAPLSSPSETLYSVAFTLCRMVPERGPRVCQNKTCSPGLALNPDNGKGAAQYLGPQSGL